MISKILDYLLIKIPEHPASTEIEVQRKHSKVISKKRIWFSAIGILLGIFISFIISDINKNAPVTNTTSTHPKEIDGSIQENGITVNWPSYEEFFILILITTVICMISYPGLYSSLKIYKHEPAFLILCFSFQYGFFWQSVVQVVLP